MAFRAVIFDMFGTLTDEPTAFYTGLNERIAEIVGADAGEFARIWGASASERMRGLFATCEESLRHVFGQLGVDFDESHVARGTALRRGATVRALTPRPDAAPTIAALQETGLAVGMVSNCTIDVAEVWEDGGIAPLIENPVLSAAVRLVKPDARIYRLACERLGVRPEDCLYVGDGGDYELHGAQHVGMTPLLICVPYEPPESVTYKQEALEWSRATVSSLSEVPTAALDAL